MPADGDAPTAPALGAHAWPAQGINRSYVDWIDARLLDVTGRFVGVVVDVYDDPATLRPTWLAVATGFFGVLTAVVPIRDATRRGDAVIVAHDHQTITTAPHVDVVVAIHPTQHDALLDHYHPAPPVPPAAAP